MENAITNPLFTVETGSIVYAEPSFRFGASVLLPGITHFVPGASTSLIMTGNSDYLYTDHMNQGSLGVSGSYGVSGVSKLSAAVSAYVGNTGSENSKSLAITLNCAMVAGIEHIDFDKLTAAQFIRGLKQNVMADIKDALDKFVDMSKDAKDDAKKQAWIDAVANFTEKHGTGIVIGTLWGGWGAVELIFTKNAEASKWVYGGSAEFSYAGTGASVAVAATYGGNKKTINESAKVSVNGYANGKCVEAIVTKWHDDMVTLASKGLDDIGSAEVSSPEPTDGVDPPRPDFVAPEEDPSVAGKIGEINNLEGLETYAQASAYDKYKKTGGDKTLADWLKSSDEKNDASKAIPTNAKKIVIEEADEDSTEQMDSLSDFSEEESERDGGEEALAKKKPDKVRATSFAKYEAMGVWIANWSQLFPWLVSGHSNEVPPSSQVADMIKLRVLQQDFLTLAKLYTRFSLNPNSDFRIPMSSITLGAIANTFSNGAARISAFIASHTTGRTSGGTSDVKAQINERLQALDPDSRKIYTTWDKLGLLRGAELGLGITLDIRIPGQGGPTGRSHWQGWKRFSFKSFGLGSGGCENNPPSPSPPQTTFQLQTPNLVPCEFVGENFSIFSDFIKGWPLIYIDPISQQIRMVCYVEGPFKENCGILAQDQQFAGGNRSFYVWHGIPDNLPPGDGKPGRFPLYFDSYSGWGIPAPYYIGVPAEKGMIGSQPEHLVSPFNTGGPELPGESMSTVRLWPIPFEAAMGASSTWKGGSMSTGTGDLESKLTGVVEALGQLKRWSFDSSYWEGQSPEFLKAKEIRYSLQTIMASYIGPMSEPIQSIFNTSGPTSDAKTGNRLDGQKNATPSGGPS